LMGDLAEANQTDSARSQVEAAASELQRGAGASALARIRSAQAAHPESIDVAVSAIGMECQATGTLPAGTLDAAAATLATVRTWNYGLYDWLGDAMRDPRLVGCRGFGLPGIAALLDAAEHNSQSEIASRRRDLSHLRGELALMRGQPDNALAWFDAALAASPSAEPDYALTQAAELGQAGAPALGVRHLDAFTRNFAQRPWYPVRDMSSLHIWLLRHYGYYEREIARLRQQLDHDARNSPDDA
jgi:tetratricopeptide (TPR) repeat protein